MERIRLEVKRQPIHILLGLIIITLYQRDILTIPIMIGATALGLLSSLIIRKVGSKGILKILNFVERHDDLKSLPLKGLLAYLIGSTLAMILFEKQIALAAIIILAFGDSVSRLVGPFGKLKHPFNDAKFLEGLLAGALVAWFGAMLFVDWLEAFCAAFAAMILEGLDIRFFKWKLNDNISIPVVAGTVIWAIHTFI